MKKTDLFALLVAFAMAGFGSGCASTPKKPDPATFTQTALAATAPMKARLDSAAATAAIARFKTFNSDYSIQNITNNTKNVYAADLYFLDPFKEIRGEPDFEAYLARGAHAVKEFSMEWTDVGISDGDYYFRWIMSVKLNRDSADAAPSRTAGISHVRFGADGKVIFHQDYFDGASLLYGRIPIMGAAIRAIKNHL